MEGILSSFFSIETLVFCIVIWFAVLVLRRLVQKAAAKIAPIFPDKWEPWWIHAWRDWVLPALPIVLGGLGALFITTYPFPETFASSDASRTFFGLVAGGASGHVYRLFKAFIRAFLPEKVKEVEASLSKELPSAEEEHTPEE